MGKHRRPKRPTVTQMKVAQATIHALREKLGETELSRNKEIIRCEQLGGRINEVERNVVAIMNETASRNGKILELEKQILNMSGHIERISWERDTLFRALSRVMDRKDG
jgi:hypothetical protein